MFQRLAPNGSLALGIKRLIDIVGGVALALVAAPLVLIVWIVVVIEDGRPGFFVQVRVGRGGVLFPLIKVRTLRRHAQSVAEVGHVSAQHVLVLRSGRLVRRFKLDELPQLLLVVSGRMSLVGPRPTVPEQVAQYGRFERRRLDVRPGLTGWAQVNGNVEVSWQDRIALDVWYVDHWSLGLDLQILWRTCKVLVAGEHVNRHHLEQALAYAHRARRDG
jgi:lipopolysaccharide/colanic/teichoic acid biosynthesis glycosyltransferase